MVSLASRQGRPVAPVPSAEVEPDPLRRTLLEDLLICGDQSRGRRVDHAPGVAYDAGQVLADDIGEGVEPGQGASVVVTPGSQVNDVGAGCHGVHRLDVEDLLVAFRNDSWLDRRAGCVQAGRQDLAELARAQGHVMPGGEGGHVLRCGLLFPRVDYRYSDSLTGQAGGDAVGRP